MIVTVYNGQRDGTFCRDLSTIDATSWDDAVAQMAADWDFSDGARYLLVADEDTYYEDSARIYVAHEQPRYALEQIA